MVAGTTCRRKPNSKKINMHKSSSEFILFRQKRFCPYFFTQLLGAFNDNLFKTSLLALVAMELVGNQAKYLNNIGAAAFIVPFVIFSATAGQLADKFNKPTVIRYIKFAEIMITLLICAGFYFHNFGILIAVLCLLGSQSAFFSPVKYSILPEYLTEEELTAGNGLVEMGTFIAILTGTIAGGLMIGFEYGPLYISIATVFIAILGWWCSFQIPDPITPNRQPNLKINWEFFSQTWFTIKLAGQSKTIFLSIMGISWFWFFGSILLTQLPAYTTQIIGGDTVVLTIILACAALGIGLGSAWCDHMCGRKVEIGLVPFGAIGMTLFTFDLSFAHPPTPLGTDVSVGEFIRTFSGCRILFDVFFMGVFGGFYSVPLYVLMQIKAIKKYRSRTIAANSILNAVFMALASALAIVLFSLGLTTPNLFLVVSLLNFAVSFYIFKLIPEFLLRFYAWVLISTVYRLDVRDIEKIPHEGPAIITCNHVSFLDPVVVMAAVPRPIRFVMDHRIFKVPVLKTFFKAAGCIPIAPAKEDPECKEAAFAKVQELLEQGELIGIFPEGAICRDGELQPFKPGIDRIVAKTPVKVYPLYLHGLWGSFFSRRHGRAMFHIPRPKLFHRLVLQAGEPLAPETFSAEKLEAITYELKEQAEKPDEFILPT